MIPQEQFEKDLQDYEQIYSEWFRFETGYYLIRAYCKEEKGKLPKAKASLALGSHDTLTLCACLLGSNPAALVKKLRKQRDLLRVEKNKTSELTSLQAG